MLFPLLVDAIYAKGCHGDSNEYDIPAKYSSELINIQLKLLEKLFPQLAGKDAKSKPATTAKPSTMEATSSAASTSRVVVPAQADTSRDSSSAQTSTGRAVTSNQASSQKSTSKLEKKPKLERDVRDYVSVVVEKGRMARKLEQAAPYNMFLTAITDSKPTHREPLSITLQEIFDESLGEIESSVQINFMIDIGWLLGHYYFAGIL